MGKKSITKQEFVRACEAIRPGVTVDIVHIGVHRNCDLDAPRGFRWDGDLSSFAYHEFHGCPVGEFYARALVEFQERAATATLEPYVDYDECDEAFSES